MQILSQLKHKSFQISYHFHSHFISINFYNRYPPPNHLLIYKITPKNAFFFSSMQILSQLNTSHFKFRTISTAILYLSIPPPNYLLIYKITPKKGFLFFFDANIIIIKHKSFQISYHFHSHFISINFYNRNRYPPLVNSFLFSLSH